MIEQERVNKIVQHLSLVQQEPSLYLDCIHNAKSDTTNSTAHLSFDYAQQVFLPNLPDQPGPIYFLIPSEVEILRIAYKSGGKQYSYLIPENMLTGKGTLCIASMLHYHLERFLPDV